MDFWTMLIVGLSSFIAFVVGLAIGMVAGRGSILKNRFLWSLATGKIIGIAYDLDNDTIKFLPLEHMGRGLYFSKDIARNPAIIGKDSSVKLRKAEDINKSVLFAFIKGMYGYAVDIKDLATIGIGGFALGEEIDEPVKSMKDVADRIVEILTEKQKSYRGVVSISPDMKFGFAFNIPTWIKSAMNILSAVSLTSIEILRDSMMASDKFLQYIKSTLGLEAMKTSRTALIILVILIIAIIFFVLMFTGGGSGGG